MDKFSIEAFWTGRSASSTECARNIVLSLEELARCHEAFSAWFLLGRSLKDALKCQVAPDVEKIRKHIERRRTKADHFLGIGYPFAVWNGAIAEEYSASFSVVCGGTSEIGWCNTCQINLPDSETYATNLLTLSGLSCVINALVNIWQPNWLTISSYEHYMADREIVGAPAQVGWMTYLPIAPDNLSNAIPPVQVKPLLNGSLVITTEELFSASNPSHIEAARQAASLIKPHIKIA